ncbi:MAG: DEAD/DEAH box family ATP-dependent RNA helicase [Chitinophagales bacterium]|nr:MAG: DEAD/DEAH box family ATP-dependent RNA helicase [Chitinophagales bacterium]
MHFENLNLIPQLLKALKEAGYRQPTPIQMQAIPHLLQGRDLFGCAQTGTGKTAAFSIPLLQKLAEDYKKTGHVIRGLVLAPTRELASQIGDSLRTYGRHLSLQHAVIYGGVPQQQQTAALRAGVDILIATPGRLLDLIQQGYISLQYIMVVVLDEADRMLDMGFIHDIQKIIAMLPARRQTVLFSATLPSSIRRLAFNTLSNPVHIELSSQQQYAENVKHSLYFVDRVNKHHLLHHILDQDSPDRVLVFTRTRHGADKLVKALDREGIRSAALHGNKSQSQRQRTLHAFKGKKLRVLIATDVASRGIDVEHISHVINFDMPETPETYVHRIGRTGRAGAHGLALSFCSGDELHLLKDIHKHLRATIPVVTDHPFQSEKTTKQHLYGAGKNQRKRYSHTSHTKYSRNSPSSR